MPLAQWRCNCSAHAGPQHSQFVVRALEPNRPHHAEATFAMEPMHGMGFPAGGGGSGWWKRLRRAVGGRSRRSQSGSIQASTEPRVENPRNEADQRRGDIKVSAQGGDDVGCCWTLLDGVVCPGGVQRRFVNFGADTVPAGAAAARYHHHHTKPRRTTTRTSAQLRALLHRGGRARARLATRA